MVLPAVKLVDFYKVVVLLQMPMLVLEVQDIMAEVELEVVQPDVLVEEVLPIMVTHK